MNYLVPFTSNNVENVIQYIAIKSKLSSITKKLGLGLVINFNFRALVYSIYSLLYFYKSTFRKI